MNVEKEVAKKLAELEKINKKIETLEYYLEHSDVGEPNFFYNFSDSMEVCEIPLMPAMLFGAMAIETWEEFEPDKDSSTAGKIASRTLGALCCLPMAATALALATPVFIVFGPIAATVSAIQSTHGAIHNKRLEKIEEKIEELKQQKENLEKELEAYNSHIDDDEITA